MDRSTIQLLKTLIVVVLFILIHVWNKYRSRGKYKTYYEDKRRKFSWLDNYLKNKPDAVKQGAGTDAWVGTIFGVILFFVSMFILSFIIRDRLTIEITTASIGLGTSFLIGLFMRKAVDPNEAECPSCHCPHAWRMTGTQNIVESSDTTRSRTEITRKNELGWETTEERVSTDTVYGGYVIKDYICDNCGHVSREKEIKAWNNMPSQSYHKIEQTTAAPAAVNKNTKPEKRTFSDFLEDVSESIFEMFDDSGFLIFLFGNAIAAGIIILTVFANMELFPSSKLDAAGIISLVFCIGLPIMNFISMKLGYMHEKIRIFFFISLVIAILGYLTLIIGSEGHRFPGFVYELFVNKQ
ncbi:MAG: hypothetical protein FWB86_14585 [Treponema sp.]|nr:hypothetical protein [Treponema sp.]